MKEVICIFGGAFNPPLKSHKYIAKEVLNKYSNVKKVIFVPVNSKYNKEGLTSNEHRCNMLELICENEKDLSVSRIETESDRPVFTIETLEYMKRIYPKNNIWLLIGSDNLKDLSTWKEAEKLVGEFKVVVLRRGKDIVSKIVETDKFLNKYKENIIKIDDNIYDEFSSTIVRDIIKKDEDVSSYLEENVLWYIKKNKLYKGE